MCSSSEKDAEEVNTPSRDELSSGTDDRDDWFASDFFGNYGNEYETDKDVNHASTDEGYSESQDMGDVMMRLQRREANDIVKDYRQRSVLVQSHMGNMTLCRGSRGEELRQSGAITALLSTLNQVYSHLSSPNEPMEDESESMEATVLATWCWGAIRDLSCHNAGIRSEVRAIILDKEDDVGGDAIPTNGLELMARYLTLYDGIAWKEIASREHLKLLTNTIGALRNVTHSTGDNCTELHEYRVTSLLMWRLLHDGPSLPDVNLPWREASFRAGATLINMAEKCNDCAVQCARNVELLHILIECWGGKACHSIQMSMTLHLGLVAILKAAKQELSEQEYAQSWDDILRNEEKRKAKARQREKERKQRLESA